MEMWEWVTGCGGMVGGREWGVRVIKDGWGAFVLMESLMLVELTGNIWFFVTSRTYESKLPAARRLEDIIATFVTPLTRTQRIGCNSE